MTDRAGGESGVVDEFEVEFEAAMSGREAIDEEILWVLLGAKVHAIRQCAIAAAHIAAMPGSYSRDVTRHCIYKFSEHNHHMWQAAGRELECVADIQPVYTRMKLAIELILRNNDWTDQSLRGVDFSGLSLAHCKLFRTDFAGACLAGVNFRGALLLGASFDGADLRGAGDIEYDRNLLRNTLHSQRESSKWFMLCREYCRSRYWLNAILLFVAILPNCITIATGLLLARVVDRGYLSYRYRVGPAMERILASGTWDESQRDAIATALRAAEDNAELQFGNVRRRAISVLFRPPYELQYVGDGTRSRAITLLAWILHLAVVAMFLAQLARWRLTLYVQRLYESQVDTGVSPQLRSRLVRQLPPRWRGGPVGRLWAWLGIIMWWAKDGYEEAYSIDRYLLRPMAVLGLFVASANTVIWLFVHHVYLAS